VTPLEPDAKFGVLKHLDLRTLWPHEALEFTPWLARNLDVLSETLGMDLELRRQEAPVGSFSLDLLAHDLGSDRVVIIENQIEQTNHDHLGKLLTYAAGYDAAVAVWIAASFREEHRQALDWLNQRSDTSTQFFGIVVDAIQIDNSRPACSLRLVSFPNDWQKKVASRAADELSPRAEAYREFFQKLIDTLREKHNFTKARAAQLNNWYNFASGISRISYGLSFSTGGRVRTEVYIDRGDQAINKLIFDQLMAQRSQIDAEYGDLLSWERLDDRRACRVACYREASIDDPLLDQAELLEWSVDHLLKFKAVFGPRLNEIVPSVGFMAQSVDDLV